MFEPLLFSREYLKNKKWVIYLIIGFAVLSTATRLLVPIIIGAIIDSLESKNFNAIYLEIEYILLLAVLSAVASFVVNFGAQYSSQIYAYNLRKKVVNSMVKKKTKFFQDKTSGDLLSRTTMDIDASRNFIMNSLSQLIPTILIIIFAVGYLLYINVFYSLCLPVYILCSSCLYRFPWGNHHLLKHPHQDPCRVPPLSFLFRL